MAVDLEIHFQSSPLKPKIGALHGSAVCCPLFVFKVRKEFPSEQLGFCIVTWLLLLQILFISLILWSKLYSMVGFKARLDHPK